MVRCAAHEKDRSDMVKYQGSPVIKLRDAACVRLQVLIPIPLPARSIIVVQISFACMRRIEGA